MKVSFGRKIKASELSKMLGVMPSSFHDVEIGGLCTDSREADANTAFVALSGERVDGHDYIAAALRCGSPAVIAQRADTFPENANAVRMLVADSEAALATLARAYKSSLSCPTVAVTGSVGKTTTKDMIAAVLSQKMNTYRSLGNHNSVIGMPLSAMELSEAHECAVFEMGMSGRGEIERMSLCARPDIAVITNVGTSHMEMLGSREGIRDAKMEIVKGLREDGILLLNGDEPLLKNANGKSYRTYYVSLSCTEANFFAQNIYIENGCTYFDAYWKGGSMKGLCLSVAGRHNVYAALYALAVGLMLGVDEEGIRRGLLSYRAEGMRQNLCHFGDLTLIEDCYNASPESMRAALDVLCAVSKGRRIACLGEMLELGDESASLHRAVGEYLGKIGVDLLFTVGFFGEAIAEGAMNAGLPRERVLVCPDREAIEVLCERLCASLAPNDTLLIKGSRGVRLERVIEYLKLHYKN